MISNICVLFDIFSSLFSLYNLFPVNCSFCWGVQLQLQLQLRLVSFSDLAPGLFVDCMTWLSGLG